MHVMYPQREPVWESQQARRQAQLPCFFPREAEKRSKLYAGGTIQLNIHIEPAHDVPQTQSQPPILSSVSPKTPSSLTLNYCLHNSGLRNIASFLRFQSSTFHFLSFHVLLFLMLELIYSVALSYQNEKNSTSKIIFPICWLLGQEFIPQDPCQSSVASK